MNYPHDISLAGSHLKTGPVFDAGNLDKSIVHSPNWQALFNNLNQLGSAELQSRKHDIQRFLKENGVTYNIYHNASGANRLWELDPIPLIIEEAAWRTMEAGLQQRAHLLNLVLQDLYGSQHLLKDRILPLELVYRHKGFLRPCVGMPHKDTRNLLLYSANMAISRDGRPWVISDRVQAPSGAGYALENRMAITRITPELFNSLKVSRLSPFFEQLDKSLQALSPQKNNNARIVILTPGPSNETYFEHSYLSSYLGYTLVQGSDLMVKDRCVWLKTIGGLERVDVILRRVDDWFCDPLELKEDSLLGVPGLLQAVRHGQVAIANPLGCGILESPGLMPFLKGICRYFLHQDLLIPNIASWWCGQPKELQYVLDHLPQLVVKKIYRSEALSTAEDATAKSGAELETLRRAIQATPWLYVGQEKVNFAPTPTFEGGRVQNRNALFRTFLVNTGQEFIAMEGGLTSTSGDNSKFLISNQLGGFSKDTWIISNRPAPSIIKDSFTNSMTPQRTMLPSKTAESLFWVGRYGERLLGCARIMRTVMQFVADGERLLDEDDVYTTEKQLLQILTHYSCTYPGFVGKDAAEKLENPWPELTDLVLDAQRPGSLHYNMREFMRVVNSVRDHWTTDNWRVLKNMEEQWEQLGAMKRTGKIKLLQALDETITSMVAFVGLNRESISREQGWSMLDMGRKLEQSLLLTSMVRSAFAYNHSDQVMYYIQEAVLKTHEALVNYRYKNRTHLQLPLVIDLLLLDPTNPRSMLFQVERLLKWVKALPQSHHGHHLSPQEKLVLEAHTMLQLADKEKLLAVEPETNTLPNLVDFLEKLYSLLSAIPVAISKAYFLHSQQQKQLFAAKPEV